jgi:5-methylthioribose kinase
MASSRTIGMGIITRVTKDTGRHQRQDARHQQALKLARAASQDWPLAMPRTMY